MFRTARFFKNVEVSKRKQSGVKFATANPSRGGPPHSVKERGSHGALRSKALRAKSHLRLASAPRGKLGNYGPTASAAEWDEVSSLAQASVSASFEASK